MGENAEVATPESYEGWSNRETWAVALHVNNDEGWQESVREALREMDSFGWEVTPRVVAEAGDIIRENVEARLDGHLLESREDGRITFRLWDVLRDIGSLWRVDWSELGASFLTDLAEQS